MAVTQSGAAKAPESREIAEVRRVPRVVRGFQPCIEPASVAGFFLFYLIRVNPALVFQEQSPPMLLTWGFFAEFLQHPGGAASWAASFLTHMLRFPLTGSVVVSLIVWAIVRVLSTILTALAHDRRAGMCALALVPVLLYAHAYYDYSLVHDLDLLIAALGLFAWMRAGTKPTARLLLLAAIMACAYLAAGQAVAFLALGIVTVCIAGRRRAADAIMVLGATAILPALAILVYQYNIGAAYMQFWHGRPDIIPLLQLTDDRWQVLALVVTNMALLTCAALWPRLAAAAERRLRGRRLPMYVPSSALFILIVLAGFLAADNKRAGLMADRHAERGEWSAIMQGAGPTAMPDPLTYFQIHNALAHSGLLLERMFAFPQPVGAASEGLLFARVPGSRALLAVQTAELMFDMGDLARAQQYGHEAIGVRGLTPRNLRLLARVYAAKGDSCTAAKVRGLLALAPFPSAFLRSVRRKESPPVRPVRTEFITQSLFGDLPIMLAEEPDNRLVFDYLMAYGLLTKQIAPMLATMPAFVTAGYDHMPRYLQEALALAAGASDAGAALRSQKLPLDSLTISRFNSFGAILNQSKGREHARKALAAKYADTYWYYYLYSQESPAHDR